MNDAPLQRGPSILQNQFHLCEATEACHLEGRLIRREEMLVYRAVDACELDKHNLIFRYAIESAANGLHEPGMVRATAMLPTNPTFLVKHAICFGWII